MARHSKRSTDADVAELLRDILPEIARVVAEAQRFDTGIRRRRARRDR